MKLIKRLIGVVPKRILKRIPKRKKKIKTGGYAYTNTRIRVMKTELLTRQDYDKLLKMQLAEFTRYIEEHGYKNEIDTLATNYNGITLLEYAIAMNRAAKYNRILNFALRDSKEEIGSYLKRWEVLNIKTAIAGLFANTDKDEILRNIMSVGDLDKEFFKRELENHNNVVDFIDCLANTEYKEALDEALPLFEQTNETAYITDALDNYYYSTQVKNTAGKLLEYLQLEIDCLNIMLLLRLKTNEAPEERYKFIEGGKEFSVKDLQELSEQDHHHIVRAAKHKLGIKITDDTSISEIEMRVEKKKFAFGRNLMKSYASNINFALGYLITKKVEGRNLRLMIMGSTLKLPEEMIKEQLVM